MRPCFLVAAPVFHSTSSANPVCSLMEPIEGHAQCKGQSNESRGSGGGGAVEWMGGCKGLHVVSEIRRNKRAAYSLTSPLGMSAWLTRHRTPRPVKAKFFIPQGISSRRNARLLFVIKNSDLSRIIPWPIQNFNAELSYVTDICLNLINCFFLILLIL